MNSFAFLKRISELSFDCSIRRVLHVLMVVIFILNPAVSTFAQKYDVDGLTFEKELADSSYQLTNAPAPIKFNSNVTCADLNSIPNGHYGGAFSHMNKNWGLKFTKDPSIPFNGMFTFTDTADTTLEGGAPAEYWVLGHLEAAGTVANWSSNKPITAVIVKGGTSANVYPYSSTSLGGFPAGDGTNLTSVGQNAINHVIFCYNDLAPTGAEVSVSGRVMAANGQSVARAVVSITNIETGEIRHATTNGFGFYVVTDLEVGSFYYVSVYSKRHQFDVSTRGIWLIDELADVDFVAVAEDLYVEKEESAP